MTQKVKISDPGDTIFLEDEIVDKSEVKRVNRQAEERGEQGAIYEQLLMGITKSALYTDSFISAASFQNTTRVLTEAALMGKVDNLEGLKESVIIGHRIPAGTGAKYYYKMIQEAKESKMTLQEIVQKLLKFDEETPKPKEA
jgi:DNA-directed RNA polymerase subunit beta'